MEERNQDGGRRQGRRQTATRRPRHSGSSFPAAACLVERETLIPAPAPRQAKNIPEKQQPPPPPFLICSCIWSAMLGSSRAGKRQRCLWLGLGGERGGKKWAWWREEKMN